MVVLALSVARRGVSLAVHCGVELAHVRHGILLELVQAAAAAQANLRGEADAQPDAEPPVAAAPPQPTEDSSLALQPAGTTEGTPPGPGGGPPPPAVTPPKQQITQTAEPIAAEDALATGHNEATSNDLAAEQSGDDQVSGYTHQDFSEMLGTYRETVTQTLNDFKADGLIDIGRKQVALLERSQLELLADL